MSFEVNLCGMKNTPEGQTVIEEFREVPEFFNVYVVEYHDDDATTVYEDEDFPTIEDALVRAEELLEKYDPEGVLNEYCTR